MTGKPFFNAFWLVLALGAALAHGLPRGIECPKQLAGARYVAIVDPYSSGAELAPRIREMGREPLWVQSTPEALASFRGSLRPGDFAPDARIIHRGDLAETAGQLARLGVRAVITGSDPGVELAEDLRTAMALRGNDPRLAPARRSKFLMHEELRLQGLAHAKQILSSDIEQILAWARRENEGRWPIVIKPIDSSGGEGVAICSDEASARNAFAAIHGKPNKRGAVNREVLAQEYLDGTEYIVDLVFHDGQALVTDLWRYHKGFIGRDTGGSALFYDRDELLDFEGPIQSALSRYGIQAGLALGMRNGAAHLEIMMTARGPVLVELNARMIGGHGVDVIREVVGISPVELQLEMYLQPERFRERLRGAWPLVRRKYASVVQLVTPASGKLGALPLLDSVRALPSFFRLNLSVKPGDPLTRTVDLNSSPGDLLLVHDDEEVLMRDFHRLREWEKGGRFYVLER